MIVIVTCLLLTGCNSRYVPEPKIEAGDPVHGLNPTRWVPNENDLIWPPGAH